MRYTAVFEFKEGAEPKVGKNDGWLGGELCAVMFSDGLEELKAIKEAAEEVIFQNAHMGDETWYRLAGLLGWEVGDDFAPSLPSSAAISGAKHPIDCPVIGLTFT